MSPNDGSDFLYLIWKDVITRRQFIVGQLSKNGQFEFQYYGEVDLAIENGFTPLVSFPDFKKLYISDRIFPIFSSRLPDKKRKNIGKILEKYNMNEYDEYTLLKNSGAKLPIDTLEFIDPILNLEQPFNRCFFIAGVRHYINCNGDLCKNSLEVNRGDEVFFKREPENPHDKNAVQILDKSNVLLGYVPRYYSSGVTELIINNREIKCYVCNVDKNKNCNECIKISMDVK